MSAKNASPDYARFPYPRLILSRPVRRLLQYLLVRPLLGLAGLLTVRACQAVGRGLGRVIFPLARRDRGICAYQLEMIFPEMPPPERRRLAINCFQHMGMTLWEVLAMPKIRADPERWVRIEGEAILRETHGMGRGVVMVTGHMGNWELLAVAFEQMRIPAQAVVRSLVNDRINQLLIKNRKSEFMQPVQRGSKESPRQLLNCLKRGDVLVVALDQDTDVPGLFVDFFGLPANTPRVAASLALKLKVPLVTGFDQRRPDGSHLFRFERIPVPEDWSNTAENGRAITQTVSDAIEAQVRRFPEQWAWNHRRWKRRPPASRASLRE